MSAAPKLRDINAPSETLPLKGWDDFNNDEAPDWVKDVRKKSYAHVQKNGLPSKKLERFKYTDLPAYLKNKNLNFAETPVKTSGNLDYKRGLINHSDEAPEWLKDLINVSPVGENKYNDMALWHACNAFYRDGLTIDVPENTKNAMPIEIEISAEDGTYFVPRTIFHIGKSSEFCVIERHQGQGTYWNNRVTQIHIEKDARLNHYRFQENTQTAVYTQNTHVRVEAGGTYEAAVLTSGCGLSRNQIHVELLGEGAECTLNGINLLKGTQIGDTTITIEHKAPNCVSHQNYRNVLDDQATGIFQGKVHVHQIAQKTDGYQKSDTLLLSDGAQMNTKPELEIYADDVKCSHGTTTGKLEETPLFYLRSRGIPEDEARALLIQSFVAHVVDKITNEDVQAKIRAKVEAWLKL